MSFSSKVKFETAAVFGIDRHCYIAELSAIINQSGVITDTQSENERRVFVYSDNEIITVKFMRLMQMTHSYECERVFINDTLKEAVVSDSRIAEKLLLGCGLISENKAVKSAGKSITKLDCCKKAYVRGAFLCSGSISDPDVSYHLEFVCADKRLADGLIGIINSFGLSAKLIKRKTNNIVYIKEASQIADILNIIGAHTSLLEFENARVSKEMNNAINRKVNFSSANDNKTISAAVDQMNDIKLINETRGIEFLPPQLQKLAKLRIEHPELSIRELGAKLDPPLGKSGVNHRLRKIKAAADSIKKENNNQEAYYGTTGNKSRDKLRGEDSGPFCSGGRQI